MLACKKLKVLAAATLLALPIPSISAVDAFLKITGIQGESTDEKHKGEIEILSWSWGASNSGTMAHGSGGGAGKACFNEFSFTKRTDAASPALMVAVMTGAIKAEATLSVRKAGGTQQDYLKFELKDVMISSFTVAGASENPVENVTLNFTEVALKYSPQRDDGTLQPPITGAARGTSC